MTTHKHNGPAAAVSALDKNEFLEYTSNILATLTSKAINLGMIELGYFLSMASMEAADSRGFDSNLNVHVETPRKMSA